MARHGPLDKKQIIILHALCYLRREQRCEILRTAERALDSVIWECALNAIRGNVKLENRQRSRLKPYATLFRRLAVA